MVSIRTVLGFGRALHEVWVILNFIFPSIFDLLFTHALSFHIHASQPWIVASFRTEPHLLENQSFVRVLLVEGPLDYAVSSCSVATNPPREFLRLDLARSPFFLPPKHIVDLNVEDLVEGVQLVPIFI